MNLGWQAHPIAGRNRQKRVASEAEWPPILAQPLAK